MSLYALIRNAYDPVTKCYHFSASDIEMEGHLDGNLCRCTGYAPILKAAKTFITDDLKGQLINDSFTDEPDLSAENHEHYISYKSETSNSNGKPFSCGRPGGCCRDSQMPPAGLNTNLSRDVSSSDDTADSLETDMTSSASSVESLDQQKELPTVGASYGKPMKSRQIAKVGEEVEGLKKTSLSFDSPISNKGRSVPVYDLKPYSPQTELLFPSALRKFPKRRSVSETRRGYG